MIKKIAVAFFAVVLLSGCSASRGKNGGDSSKYMSEFEKTAGDKVFFKLDSAELSSESESTLARQAEWLEDHKHFNVTVEGHCDERGTREYNIALGEKRAHAAMKYLVKHGVAADRIDTISYGKERPAVDGNDESAWSQNRRAVTVLK